MNKLIFVVFVLFMSISVAQKGSENYVIMVSLDGFRADYLEKHNAKNILNLAKKGIRVKRMIPSNPTKTFPNHYTLVTGLYPDNHGLIGNYFYDPELQKEYSLRNRSSVQNGQFYGGEPIWNTARKAGLKTASYFWVGSEAKINGMQPDIWKKFNSKITFEQRIDSVISWLKLPVVQRPRLVLLYFEEPDGAGHRYGPESKETGETVKYVDSLIGNFYNRLMQLPIANRINLIFVADHGMRKISRNKQVVLTNHLKDEWIEGIYGNNPVFTIKAKKGMKETVYQSLKKVKHLNVFKRNEAPKKFHFAYNKRVNDLIVVAKSGYSVFKEHASGRQFGGAHGYLNNDKQMSALFVAKGNTFKEGYVKNQIKNIEVYNLIAHILGITPAPNDGDFNNVKDFLKE